MKVNLEIIHSCTLKRKKTAQKFCWLGKEKEQIYVLDGQKINQIDPNNGKIKRIPTKIKSYFKSFVSYSITNNGIYLVAILQSGDLLVWNKDTDMITTILGKTEFSLKLGNHAPSICMSNDMKKIVLITSRNKVFIWESEQNDSNNGNWSDIVASKDIKTVEDNKELDLDVCFVQNSVEGISATCCFLFNYENKIILNVLKIKWINPENLINACESRFETIWISHEINNWPKFQSEDERNNFEKVQYDNSENLKCLSTKGAYLSRLSHNGKLISIAINQKKVANSLLGFMSIASGKIKKVNLKNFGLNSSAQGRKYWIKDLCWTYNDLYVAGITKHGSIFLVSRLGQPLFIHAIGKEIDMGPALFLTLHPLIVVREKGLNFSKNDDVSINSTLDNDRNQKQTYSIKQHPNLPIFICSDGFLMCILKIETAFSTHTRLIRELVHETIHLLNSVSEKTDLNNPYFVDFDLLNDRINTDIDKFKKNKRETLNLLGQTEPNVPDWSLGTVDLNLTTKSSDSGVDSNNEPKRKSRSNSLANSKIAEGKIIFSFLPQVLPISLETIDMHSIVKQFEQSFENLVSSWSLIASMSDLDLFIDLFEFDKKAKAIQQAFAHFSYLFLSSEVKNIKNFQYNQVEVFPKFSAHLNNENDEEIKLKILINLFFSFLNVPKFDSSNHHILFYIPQFLEKFIQSIIKYDNKAINDSIYSTSRIQILSLVYNLLKCVDDLFDSYANTNTNEMFRLTIERIQCNKTLDYLKETTNFKSKILAENPESTDNSNRISSDKIETDSLEKQNEKKNTDILIKSKRKECFNYGNLVTNKCWKNLLHYSYKYRMTLESLGSIREKSLNEIDLFIILLERHVKNLKPKKNLTGADFKLDIKAFDISKQSNSIKIDRSEVVYFNYGEFNASIDYWIVIESSLFELINKKETKNKSYLIRKSILIIHKIFYSCLSNNEIKKFLEILNKFIEGEFTKLNCQNEPNLYSPFNIFSNTFQNISVSKPLQKMPIALVIVLQSLARFIALYLLNNEKLFYFSVNNPIPMPSIVNIGQKKNAFLSIKNFISKEKITSNLNSKIDNIEISEIFTPDKVVEIYLATELYDEAIYFLNSINDWKSSFLINSILKESKNWESIKNQMKLPDEMQSEHLLILKVFSLLGLDKKQNQLEYLEFHLMEKSYLESVSLIVKELLIGSVMTKSNVLAHILNFLIKEIVFLISKLSSKNIIVCDNFFLPAPPIFCSQIYEEQENSSESLLVESNIRNKLCILSKCFIVLLSSSNLHVPLIKWYLENLLLAKNDMNNKHGIKNNFQPSLSMANLLSAIRYQKIGYIPENILSIFRDFCAILFFIDLRDKFSITLRQYIKLLTKNLKNSDTFVALSIKLIDYGNLVLGFRCLFGKEHLKIQDIIVSTIAKLSPYVNEIENFDLDQKLAECIEKKPFYYSAHSQNLDENIEFINLKTKLNNLRDEWKNVYLSQNQVTINMTEAFDNKLLHQKITETKIQNLYGIGEDILSMLYLQDSHAFNNSLCGGFNFERSELFSDYLELFFRIAFDQTENWATIVQQINNVPLLPEFYEILREQLIDKNEFKQYLITKQDDEINNYNHSNSNSLSTIKRKTKHLENQLNKSIDFEFCNDIYHKNGLFRSYSLKNIHLVTGNNLSKKSVSFSNLIVNDTHNSSLNSDCNGKIDNNKIKRPRNDEMLTQSFNVFDYGPSYIQISNLAIWLLKWSNKFQKILTENSKVANQFSHNNNLYTTFGTTIKLNNLNANMLVGCVFLTNNNNLNWTSKNQIYSNNNMIYDKMIKVKEDQDDELTQVTYSNSIRNKTKSEKSLMAKKFNNDISPESTSLDISSYNEIELRNLIKESFKENAKKRTTNEKNNFNLTTLDYISDKSDYLKEKSFNNKRNDLIDNFSNTLDVTDYYDLENLKNSNNHLEKIKINKTIELEEKPTNAGTMNLINYENKLMIEKEIKKKKHRNSSGSFDFITNIFKSKSPSPSRSPSRNLKTESQTQLDDSKNISNTIRSNLEQQLPSFQNQPSNLLHVKQENKQFDNSDASNIQQLIRDELKRIVQIQHNTVMNLLNNQQTNNPIYPNQIHNLSLSNDKNFENKLISTFQKQIQSNNLPSEFVIETKIKKVDSSNKINYENPHEIKSKKILDDQQQTYFMTSFDVKQPTRSLASKQNAKKSKFVNIPLLKTKDNKQNIDDLTRAYESNVNLPYIHFNRESKFLNNREVNDEIDMIKEIKLLSLNKSTNSNISNKLIDIGNDYKDDSAKKKMLGNHLKNFSEKMKKKESYLNSNRYHLLKLNYEEKYENNQKEMEVKNEDEKETNVDESQYQCNIEPVYENANLNKNETKRHNPPKDVSVQIQKPIYDGYILKPNSFENDIENVDNLNGISTAQVHYDSTRHLRNLENFESKKLKSDTATMTDDAIKQSIQLPPDILFKLEFDSDKKKLNQDFINVVDLDTNSVDQILKMIEIEQKRRQEQSICATNDNDKSKKNRGLINQEIVDIIDDKIEPNILQNNEETLVHRDKLTKNILEVNQDQSIENNKESLINQIDEINQSSLSNNHRDKNKTINKLKFIDEKIRLMNEMANEMTNDYSKYNKLIEKMIDNGQNANDSTNLIKKNDKMTKVNDKIETKPKKDKIYKTIDNQVPISDLGKKINNTTSQPKNSDARINKLNDPKVVRNLKFSDDLSDLNELEESKLKKIMKSSLVLSDADKTISATLNDVFNEEDKSSIKDSLRTCFDNQAVSKEIDRTDRSKEIDRKSKYFSSRNQLRNTSPNVKKEKELFDKRENMLKKFTLKREEEAKTLLKDIMNSNIELVDKQFDSIVNTNRESNQLRKSVRAVSNKYNQNQEEIPEIFLEKSLINLDDEENQNAIDNFKPSLMAKTIKKLRDKEESEHLKTDKLLKELEKRALNVTKMNESVLDLKQVKHIKPLSSVVRLQNPQKLRTRPAHDPLTYSQLLMLHQKININAINSKTNLNELYKVYGSKRVKGIYQSKTPAIKSSKTYTERLKELRPSDSCFVVSKNVSDIKKNYIKKPITNNKKSDKNVKLINKCLNQKIRYSPYDQNLITKDVEDLIKWSLDDKLKQIIYDQNPIGRNLKSNKKTNGKQPKSFIKESDQDTLADTDFDYLYDDLVNVDFEEISNQDDYVNQVKIEDLMNISLSTESAVSFIDWEQIEQIVNNN